MLQAPEDVSVLSNMPAAYSLNIDNGLRRTGFPPTPAMSTYLLAIAAGHVVGVNKQVGLCSSSARVRVQLRASRCRASVGPRSG